MYIGSFLAQQILETKSLQFLRLFQIPKHSLCIHFFQLIPQGNLTDAIYNLWASDEHHV